MNSTTYQKEKTEYDIQAEKFLKETGTEFKAVYLKHDKYFDNDKEKRDIYTITLTRGDRSYLFTFGQSIACSGKYIVNYHSSAYPKGYCINSEDELKRVKFYYHYFGKDAITENKEYRVPTAYDVLSHLEKYETDSFADFCANYGYDEDSRSAERVFKACQEQYTKLCTLYNPEEMDKLREIQYA